MTKNKRGKTRYLLMDDDCNEWMCEKCHYSFQFMEGDPKENDVAYCARCGAEITALDFDPFKHEKAGE